MKLKCNWCHRTGEVVWFGIIHDLRYKCPDCNGTGKVGLKQKIRRFIKNW